MTSPLNSRLIKLDHTRSNLYKKVKEEYLQYISGYFSQGEIDILRGITRMCLLKQYEELTPQQVAVLEKYFDLGCDKKFKRAVAFNTNDE